MPEVVKDNKALVLRTKDPNKYISAIGRVQLLDDDIIAFKHDTRNFFLARNCGAKLQGYEPIRYYFDYPKIGGQHGPMIHQRDATAFLTTHMRAFDLSEMATGKTASAIWSAEYLLQQKIVKKVLILCTLSTVWQVWDEHLFKILPHRNRVVLHGDKVTRVQLLQQEVEFYIINHDGLKVIQEWLAVADFDLVIVDEGSKYADSSTDRYKCLVGGKVGGKLRQGVIPSHAWVWWLTGTPCAQSPVQAWAQARVINPRGVPAFVEHWRNAVMRPHPYSPRKYVPSPDSKDKVFNALQPAFRVAKRDVIDLPPIVYTTRQCRLTKEQESAYRKIKTEAAMIHSSGVQITAVNAAVILGKLRQVLCGVVKGDDSQIVEFDCGPRLETLCETFAESQSKCIVFVPFTAVLKKVVEYISSECGLTVAVIDGSVTGANRGAILTRFQNADDPQIIVANPEAAAHGLNLTAADTIIWFAPIFSTETYLQANERINRPGQKLSMRIVHIMSNSLEKKLYDALKDNALAHEQILNLYRDEVM